MSPALPVAGLLAMAALLAGTVALEVWGGMPDSGAVFPLRASTAGPVPPQPVPAASAAAPPSLAGLVPGMSDEAAAAIALARPLFSPTRRPAAGPSRPGAPIAAAAPLPRMTGTLVTSSLRRAIFAGADGKSVVVPEGGQLGAYTVKAVRAGQVVVSGPEGERTVSPVFDPDAPPSTPPEPAPGTLPGLPGFRLDGAGPSRLGGIPGLTSPAAAPPPPRPAPR